MRHVPLEQSWLSLADLALPLAGLLLLVLGTGSPSILPLAWGLIALALLAWMAEVEGIAVPRPGRVPIVPYGCWEVPQAFVVRHGYRYLLLSRDEDPVDGGWSETYSVRELAGAGPGALRGLRGGFPPPQAWTGEPVARVAVRALRFEHHERSSYVVRGSLERALRRAQAR
jgi:hypothetical protein